MFSSFTPRLNPNLVGHGAAERLLLDSVNGGRLAHAWLITGPRGIGKATLAFRFARFLLAGGAEGGGAGGLFGAAPPADSLHIDPDHPVFRRVAAAGHADLVTVERAYDDKRNRRRTEIVVDDVRGVGGFLSMTAAEGGWRVVVIDAADEMNRNAANAVLKVLEEPPRRAVLLLVCHNPGRLLPTIRSRCSRLALRPLDDAAMDGLLRAHAPDLDPAQRAVLMRLCEGSIGRALDLAAQGGLELYDQMVALLETLPDLDVAALHRFGDRVGRAGAEDQFRSFGELFRAWLARLAVFAARGRAEIEAEATLMARLRPAATGTGAGTGALDPLLEVWEKTNRLMAQADGVNLDRKQVTLNVFLALEAAVRS
ncbi:MAG: DNA polymerase III subunit delta' [Hyphomicrobiales bacterium]|nr:DNA polymerase III subunit delta' [Hyphomicrobiales bacterium]